MIILDVQFVLNKFKSFKMKWMKKVGVSEKVCGKLMPFLKNDNLQKAGKKFL